MGNKTRITWTDATWNPWRGCRKVSAGCKNCYMYRDAARYGHDPSSVMRSKTTFNDPLEWKEPCKVFTCSWSDFFIEDADPWRAEAWDIIRRTPHLTYQILTKRAENIKARLPLDWGDGYPNVWLIATAENQGTANKRIPELLSVPAKVRGLSCEPLLGPIDLMNASPCGYYCDEAVGHVDHPFSNFQGYGTGGGIHWVIVGGESGPNFRMMDLKWARSLREQCVAVDVAFWFKQQSALRPGVGAELDGVVWNQFPEVEQ